MYDRILVPTDGGDVAANAAETAITLAARFGADLHAIHVLGPGAQGADVADDEPRSDDGGTHGDAVTSTVVEAAQDGGVDATGSVLETDDSIHETILSYAEAHDVDCIAMGTHGRSGLERLRLGSVTERTLRAATVPVVTVSGNGELDRGFDSVLLPTDGSEHALAAADHAIDLTLAIGGALHVVHVVDVGVVWDDVSAGMLLDALEEAGERAVDEVIDRADAADVSTVQASILSGSPYRAIVEYAEDNGVDCVVMGTHGRTGFDRLLLGSVTERVVRLTDVPVITITHPDTAD